MTIILVPPIKPRPSFPGTTPANASQPKEIGPNQETPSFFLYGMFFAIKHHVMHRVKAYVGVLLLLVFGLASPSVRAEVFTLENGTTLEGTMATLDEDGFIVRLDIGEFSTRTELVYLSQETLRRLAEDPKYSELVTPFIDLPEEEMKPPEINVRQPERLERIEEPGSFLSSIGTPIGILFLIAFYAGNLLAAFEVAIYRARPPALVCGLSVILPVVTPIIFLSLPAAEGSYADHEQDEEEMVEASDAGAPPPPPPTATAGAPGVPAMGQAKLGLQKSAAGAAAAEAKTFTRSDTDFNRHFFETTFSEFFRVVPSASIKDMVLEFKSAKKELIAKRVSRISGNEIHIQLVDGKKEESLTFGEILQVKLRHKDTR